MQLDTPDPEFVTSAKARHNFLLAARIAVITTAVIWFVWIADAYLGLDLGRFGLRPRDLEGLLGLFTAPLLHANFEHLFANTLPLLVSLTAVLYLYPNAAMRVIPMTWIGTGILAWAIGRPSLHIGASGFVYGLLAFVFLSGLFRRDMRSVGVSLAVWFLYGSMVWGLLPIRPDMSWEMHFSGALLGVIMAFLYTDRDRVPIKRYEWEDDDSVPDWFPDEHDSGDNDPRP
ncbi:rhomboid family intramembrane serine protease [Marinihelvus fidelis]|uniref:Rhomboid family intramembrane serine protease n=1 Tax=Marinihelvus fidelis TaxID=2613842 RepID=A0A5N0TBY1_9GAMM|nr:rhomboid family intramembrane serine protease [Marinihelvus fidelis]KAA9131924.1 rhomboid family intramembrane serine protease [Marinihelvus fidelis]